MGYLSNKLISSTTNLMNEIVSLSSVEEVGNRLLIYLIEQLKLDAVIISPASLPTIKHNNLEQMDKFRKLDITYDDFESYFPVYTNIQNHDELKQSYNDYYHQFDFEGKILFMNLLRNTNKCIVHHYNTEKTNKIFREEFNRKYNAHHHSTIIFECLQTNFHHFAHINLGKTEKSGSFTRAELKILTIVGNFLMEKYRNLVKYINVNQTIEEQKKHLDLSLSVVDTMKEAIYIFDKDLNAVLHNSVAEAFLKDLQVFPVQLDVIGKLKLPVKIVSHVKSFLNRVASSKLELDDNLTGTFSLTPEMVYKYSISSLSNTTENDDNLYIIVKIEPISYKSKVEQLGNSYNLTPKERELVLTYVTGSSKGEEIAEKMQISVETVKYHFSNIFTKLDITNKQEIFLML